MHELSITESILNLSLEYANQAKAKQVTDIFLVIGRLSSVVDDSVQFYWDIISQDTICEGAQLHFERPSAQLECLDCGTHFVLESELSPCPSCNSMLIKVISGDQFYLDSIQVCQ